MRNDAWDAIIVGGGPAGLSAALLLGRCLRRVLVADAGRQRNRRARRMHGFLTQDGTAPDEFLRLAREQLRPYDTVTLVESEALAASCHGERFVVMLRDGASHEAPALLLATGVTDRLPPLEGIEAFYGRSVHHCPYCDGYEWRGRRIAVYGSDDGHGGALALLMLQWSPDVHLFVDGAPDLSDDMRERLLRRGIVVHEPRIARLCGNASALQSIELADGRRVDRDALFFNAEQHQRSPLAEVLGCRFTARGGVDTGDHDVTTNVPGLYVAGDATRDVQLVAVAVAEGVKAAFAIHKRLLGSEGLL